MFSQEFEILLIAALAVITVMLFIGKGDFFLQTKQQQKKKAPEEQKKFSRGVSYFTGVMTLAEVILFAYGSVQWVTIAYLAAMVIIIAGLIFYCKKSA